MALYESEVKSGYRLCPHCEGKTSCNCASCGGEEKDGYAKHIPYSLREYGICKVCNGTGQVPK